MKILLNIFFLAILFSCATEKGTAQINSSKSMTVSFYSPGNGINQEAKNAYDAFLHKNYPSLNFDTILWGREGEIDYCFQNIALSSKKTATFIQETRDFLSKYDRINITEDQPCKQGTIMPK